MNPNIESQEYKKLYQLIYDLYHLEENKSKLLFHGWHHIKFVHDKAIEFAEELNADLETIAIAALIHDINYIFTDNLEPETANEYISNYLSMAGFSNKVISRVQKVVEDEHIGYRFERNLSNEAKALSDADTLFKALPTTLPLFSSKYIEQNKYDIYKLAEKIIKEQKPLLLKGDNFYSKSAKKKYLKWAKANLAVWENVLEALEDKSVAGMLKTAEDLGVL